MNRFTDQGIIIAVRKYGENSLIVKILSAKNGICSGFVRFAAANYKKSSFQATIYHNLNWVEFEWSSRIANNLGSFTDKFLNLGSYKSLLNIFIKIISFFYFLKSP